MDCHGGTGSSMRYRAAAVSAARVGHAGRRLGSSASSCHTTLTALISIIMIMKHDDVVVDDDDDDQRGGQSCARASEAEPGSLRSVWHAEATGTHTHPSLRA